MHGHARRVFERAPARQRPFADRDARSRVRRRRLRGDLACGSRATTREKAGGEVRPRWARPIERWTARRRALSRPMRPSSPPTRTTLSLSRSTRTLASICARGAGRRRMRPRRPTRAIRSWPRARVAQLADYHARGSSTAISSDAAAALTPARPRRRQSGRSMSALDRRRCN